MKNSIIDTILNLYKSDLGNDFELYRNHVYRVYNFAVPYVTSISDIETLSIAVAFHDLGIWTNRTFDYLEPSINLARRYSADHHLPVETIVEIETIIFNHHKLTSIQTSALAEIFRQADLVDLSLGVIRFGRMKKDINLIRKTFPNKGFHRKLGGLFLKNLVKNPMRPLPMYKF